VPEIGLPAIIFIALSLSADCFAVALSGSLNPGARGFKLVLRVALAFGIFQAGMTAAGWLAGSTIVNYIAAYDHWLAFAMLSFIGGRMLWGSRHSGDSGEKSVDITGWWTLLVLAVATSLDALAVGLSLSLLQVNVVMAVSTIGVVALAVTAIGFIAGRKLGELVGRRAEAAGGAILIIIGIIILVEHLR
jgi:putative Mn2+ efflux pump MntP